MSQPSKSPRQGQAHTARHTAVQVLEQIILHSEDAQSALDLALNARQAAESHAQRSAVETMPAGRERSKARTQIYKQNKLPLAPIVHDKRDSGLITELVYGSLRKHRRIEYFLNHFMKNPEKLPAEMHIILGMATYEIMFLDRVPEHASVNTAVSLVRSRCGQALSKVANGVLRSLCREKDSFTKEGCLADNTLASLAVWYSTPEWVLEMWNEQYGREKTCLLLEHSDALPARCLRVNTTRPDWQNTQTRLLAPPVASVATENAPAANNVSALPNIAFAHSGILLTHKAGDTLRALHQDGTFSWQGAGSQNALAALHSAQWTGSIWDACCGAGGKSCTLLEQGRELTLASDPSNWRLNTFRAELERLKLPFSGIQRASALDVRTDAPFQNILIDAPCSGLGTFARRPEIRIRRTPAQVRDCISLQQNILDSAWDKLAPGGQIAYITCTVNKAENEEQIQRMVTSKNAQCTLLWHSEPEPNTPFAGQDLMFVAVLKKE